MSPSLGFLPCEMGAAKFNPQNVRLRGKECCCLRPTHLLQANALNIPPLLLLCWGGGGLWHLWLSWGK